MKLITQDHINHFENKIRASIWEELSDVSTAIDIETNKGTLGILWGRFNQLTYTLKIINGEYTTETGTNTKITLD